jgi:hypothetical protein
VVLLCFGFGGDAGGEQVLFCVKPTGSLLQV